MSAFTFETLTLAQNMSNQIQICSFQISNVYVWEILYYILNIFVTYLRFAVIIDCSLWLIFIILLLISLLFIFCIYSYLFSNLILWNFIIFGACFWSHLIWLLVLNYLLKLLKFFRTNLYLIVPWNLIL